MKKNSKLIIGVCAAIVVAMTCLLTIHTSITDRINPLVSRTTSYAKVTKGTQRYYYVDAFDSKTKKALPYQIKEIIGYDPSGEYISIDHKGQYVKSIKYISKKQFLETKN